MKLPLERLLAGVIAAGVAGLMMAIVFTLQVPFASANAQAMAIPPPAPVTSTESPSSKSVTSSSPPLFCRAADAATRAGDADGLAFKDAHRRGR